MKYFKYIGVLALSLMFWQCEPAIDEFVPSAGSADFTTYVAIGDSYSAGYTDGALGKKGQDVSFPNIIAQQLKLVGMEGDFKQPLTAENKSVGTTTIDANGNKNGYFILKYNADSTAISPSPTAGDMTIFTTWIGNQAPFNNVAVPGAKSFHLLAPGFGNTAAGAGNYNPFYTRFASNPTTSSVIGDAMLNNPTFFSLWIGGNDVLGYALAGGEADAITPSAQFEGYINSLVSTLSSNGAKGAIANVPDINSLPYFSAIPYNALLLDSLWKADALNAAYANYNIAAAAYGYPTMHFVVGQNAFVIADDAMAALGGLRQIKSSEKILLPAQSNFVSLKWGSAVPIPNTHTLDTAEVKAIKDATTAYNTSILNFATTKSLAYIDVYDLMTKLNGGMVIDGNKYSTTFVSGGVFSLDGIHATGRGSAIIANEFINAINTKYSAAIPLVNINEYETVTFP